MNDNRDEIQRLRAMRAESVSRNDFARADAIDADLARLEGAQPAGGAVDPITGLPVGGAPAPQRPAAPAPQRPAYKEQHAPAPRPAAPAPEPAERRHAEPETRGHEAQHRGGEQGRPAYGAAGRPDREVPHGGQRDEPQPKPAGREEKRLSRFGKTEDGKTDKAPESRPASPAPRRAAPKAAPAGPTKGSRVLTAVAAAAIAVSVGATAFSGMRLAESSAIIAKNETDSVNVVVTTRDVAAGETISESDLETQSVPKAYCPTDAATKVSDVAGHTSITTQTAGTSISLSSIQASASPAHITSAIEDGHVAIALSLDSSHGLSPLLAVGDRVNVLAAVSDGTTSSTETICGDVRVVALDSALTGTPEAGYSLVTLDVTPEQAAAIVANPNVTLTAVPHAVEEADDAQ